MAYMFSGSQSSFVKHLKKRASFFEKLASFLHTVVNEKASSLWKLARFLVKWSPGLYVLWIIVPQVISAGVKKCTWFLSQTSLTKVAIKWLVTTDGWHLIRPGFYGFPSYTPQVSPTNHWLVAGILCSGCSVMLLHHGKSYISCTTIYCLYITVT